MSSSADKPHDVAELEDCFPTLLAEARGGDEDAFRAIYRAVQPLLLRYLQSLVGRDAEDVASETWLQVVRDLNRFTGNFDAFRGWSATIARNRAMDHLRHLRRHPVTSVPPEHLDGIADTVDTAVLAAEGIGTVAAVRLIASLPRDQAEAVLLRVVLALDARAAAAVVGKRPGAIRTAAHRGLRRLTDQLRSRMREGT